MLIRQIYLFDSKNPNPIDPYNVLLGSTYMQSCETEFRIRFVFRVSNNHIIYQQSVFVWSLS
jgi:hypothetical protein